MITGSIGLFLGYQAVPTLHHYGFGFFTERIWQPAIDKIGIAAVLVGTIEVALVSLVIGFPIALLTALFISEYAPAGIRSTLVALIDLMAAIPSIIYGIWGAAVLQPQQKYVARWLSQHFSWIPIFRAGGDPNAAAWSQSNYTSSTFIAGTVVGIMIVPLACAIMRSGLRPGPAGGTRGRLRARRHPLGDGADGGLPFGRGGIVGGTMLALGRSLGETVAVLLIISPQYDIKASVVSRGSHTISALIATLFGEATKRQLSALLTAGFVLFLMTLVVNTIAAIVVNRSRSGSETA